MPLDSDVSNADAFLHVTFREYKGDDKTWLGKTFVKIMVPGDKYNIVDRPMLESDKRRFPQQYQSFLMESDDSLPVGVLLETWRAEFPGELTEGQLEELRILKFRTVDQLAGASDGQGQRIGMGFIGLREKAKSYLIRKTQALGAGELEKTKNELETLKAQVAALMAKPPVADVPEKRRGCPPGGWPKKDKVNVEHDAAIGAASHK